jgi:hypothetical protein
MKYIFTYCLVGIISFAQAGVLVLSGYYQKENIYVKNSISYTGVGFCTYEVVVNGQVSTDEINSEAFEIDLSQFQFKVGDPIEIHIKYKDDGCMPKILNPNALAPNPTYQLHDIYVDEKGVLHWEADNENYPLPYIIEQYKWNKWVQIGEIMGQGGKELHHYTFETTPVAGVNKFRIKQKGHIDKTKISPPVAYTSLKSEISYVINRKSNVIFFSEPTAYEVYNKFGDLVKKGYGKEINIGNLQKGVYYMNYGNSTVDFTIKK